MSEAQPYQPVFLTELPKIGQAVFLCQKRPTGTWKHTSAKVVDMSVKPIAVKIQYHETVNKTVRRWHRLDELTLTAPMKEEKK